MSAPESQPVAVVGNGPVGQTAALLLARWGLRVRLLDTRGQRGLVGSKAICQQRDVLDVWESVGAGRAIAEEGVTWTTARTFYRDDELFVTHFEHSASSAFPPWVNLSQSRTEQILDQRIVATPNIEVLWQHEVTDIQQDAAGVQLVCRTGAGRRHIEAPYVLVAAGASASDLRDALGVSLAGYSFDDRFLICDIRADLPGREHERRFHFDPRWNPGRQVLIHACPQQTYRIDWQVPGDFDLEHEVKTNGLDKRIRKIIGQTDYEVVWKSLYRFHSRVASEFRVGRVLLVGDFAHLFAPFGARGLNSGVQDAENAAWKVAFVLKGWAPEALLETYHHERRAAAQENLEVTTSTMRFLVPQTQAEREFRSQQLELALRDPTAAHHVDSGRLAEPFWYVDSPLTTADASRPFAGRPKRGEQPAPGPGLLMPDTAVTWQGQSYALRRLLRDGFFAICGAEVDTKAASAALAVGSAPYRVMHAADLDAAEQLEQLLSLGPDEIWLVRPDAHVAAVLRDVTQLPQAVRRALGQAD